MRNSHLPLTETVFYLLTAFLEPNYGYLAIKEIEKLSGGEVRIAAGTMYGAIENLLQANMLIQISEATERRKIYQTTEYGKKVLAEEIKRLKNCITLYETLLEGEVSDEK